MLQVEEYVCSKIKRNPLVARSAASYLGEFTAGETDAGFTKGAPWPSYVSACRTWPSNKRLHCTQDMQILGNCATLSWDRATSSGLDAKFLARLYCQAHANRTSNIQSQYVLV